MCCEPVLHLPAKTMGSGVLFQVQDKLHPKHKSCPAPFLAQVLLGKGRCTFSAEGWHWQQEQLCHKPSELPSPRQPSRGKGVRAGATGS